MGEKIREYLDSHGIKQTFLAEKSGLSYQIITDICTKGRRVEAKEYFKICKALGVSLDYFFEDETDENI